MVLAYVSASDMNGAEKFFHRIKEDGLKPNVVVYGTLMKGYSKLDNVEKLMHAYERMRV
jgi:pentatricopeptide repeat protein